MKKLIVALVSLFFMIGCLGVQMTATKLKYDYQTKTMIEPDYKIGEVQKKTVGEPMLMLMKGRSYSAFVSVASFTPPSYPGIKFPYISPLMKWVCKFKTEEGNLSCDAGIKSLQYLHLNPYCLLIKPNGEAYGDSHCITGNFTRTWPETKQFNQIQVVDKDSFKKEFIYNGKTKDSIKIAYREFIDDMARPAFSQDLSYDLSESKTIGFRGMQIEVIEATNSYITFKVKSKME